MEPVTKQDIKDLKDGIGEMFTEQTKALIECVDGAKKELKRDIMDMRADVSVEIDRKIGEHVTVQHA